MKNAWLLTTVLSAIGLHNTFIDAFQTPISRQSKIAPHSVLLLSDPQNDSFDRLDSTESKDDEKVAATNTINQRLMEELEQAAEKERTGSTSEIGEKLGFNRRSEKSDEERKKSIEEAKNLNGVNPTVAVSGGVITLLVAAGLWFGTSRLGEYFALHPVESDTYFVQRATGVYRNALVGIASLASGFFGVTGIGILGLGVRVAYGVATGELDPTPLQKRKSDDFELPNVWELMTSKKGRRKRNDDNFGL
mmetsp:Transcript_18306/g.27669  ORF Transcript_18306/g.27669 Transcript_18306/m.27669 type:complete len:249 (-) Transcript_18306:171-917(-)